MAKVFYAWGSLPPLEVTITSWDKQAENGLGILKDGTEVTVFQSYDGDGYFVLSDQDTARLLEEEK